VVPRVFAPDLSREARSVGLPVGEAEHLLRVLRLGVGDMVSVFDGRGSEFLARLVIADRTGVRVQLVERVEPAAEPSVQVTLVHAVLKGEKMDEVIRDAVMLGAYAVHPIVTARTEATVAALNRGNRPDRWRRVALASVKQSGRALVPDVRSPLSFGDVLAEPASPVRLMLVEPRAEVVGCERVGALRDRPVPAAADIFIGPEGGWTGSELEQARAAGLVPLTLGHRTLRADAVAVAALSVLQFLWGDL
jgi:16S rRNA (uracil1498-N3)-methyltransferase